MDGFEILISNKFQEKFLATFPRAFFFFTLRTPQPRRSFSSLYFEIKTKFGDYFPMQSGSKREKRAMNTTQQHSSIFSQLSSFGDKLKNFL